MLELNEQNFDKALQENEQLLVFFYREKGCSFCDKMKPVVEKYAETRPFTVAKYALGQTPDSVNEKFPIERFPTFYAFQKGQVISKLEGTQTEAKLDSMFAPKIVPIEEAPLSMLLNDEVKLIDAIYPMMLDLKKVQAEIKKRKEIFNG
ncbi:MAG TPA: thioredoxin family protein [Nitrosomonas sp.]|nr:thioredoxin family protein [Nitrosomonas sp.]